MNKRQNQAIQYIKLLEEYDQADSLYDTPVFEHPESPKSGLPPIRASFSTDFDIRKPKSQQPNQYQQAAAWYSVWDAVERSIKSTDQAFTSAWQSARATLGYTTCNTMRHSKEAPQQQMMGTTDDAIQATVQAIKTATSKTRLPESLAAKARDKRNPAIPTRPRRAPSPAKSRGSSKTASRSPTKPKFAPSPPAHNHHNPNTKAKPSLAYQDASPEEPTSESEARQPAPSLTHDTRSVSSKRMEPEETSVIHMEKKEQAAKKRAARAKKKGAVKKVVSQAEPMQQQQQQQQEQRQQPPPEPPASIPTAGIGASKKKVPVSDASTSTAASFAPSYAPSVARTSESGPRPRRAVNKEPPGLRKDPPGVSRKGINDDASVAPPRRQKQIIVVQQQKQPRSIVRHDLEDKPNRQPSPWVQLLSGKMEIPQCTGTERAATPPPLRPCDIPRGSERKKKNESTRFPGVAGEFLNAAFGL